MAEAAGVSRQAYAKWESGGAVPDVEKCKRLADLYGVTIDSLLKSESTDSGAALPPAPRGKNIWGSVTIDEQGRLVLPQAVREHFGLSGGQRLIVLSDDAQGIALIPADAFERKMRQAMELAGGETDAVSAHSH